MHLNVMQGLPLLVLQVHKCTMSRPRAHRGLVIRSNHIAQLASAIEARNGALPNVSHNSSNGRVHHTNTDTDDNFYENVDVIADAPYTNVDVATGRIYGNIAAGAPSRFPTTGDEEGGGRETPASAEDAEAGELSRNISMTSLDEDKFQIPRRKCNENFIKFIKLVVIVILFLAVLASATLSKVTFAAIAAKMFDAVANTSHAVNGESDRKSYSITFTQIVFVLMSPQLITAVRMFLTGIIGKNRSSYPWPSIGPIIGVRMAARLFYSHPKHLSMIMDVLSPTVVWPMLNSYPLKHFMQY